MTPFSALLAQRRRQDDVVSYQVPDDWGQGRTLFGGVQSALAVQAMKDVVGSLWPAGQAMLFPPNAEQNAMIGGLSQLGILFLLLLAGMETDLGLAYRLRRSALVVSLSGIAVPFACGFALGFLLPEQLLPDPDKRLVAALFLGTALSISSLKIVATVVREMNFMRRNVGQLLVASAVIDDTAKRIAAIRASAEGKEGVTSFLEKRKPDWVQ